MTFSTSTSPRKQNKRIHVDGRLTKQRHDKENNLQPTQTAMTGHRNMCHVTERQSWVQILLLTVVFVEWKNTGMQRLLGLIYFTALSPVSGHFQALTKSPSDLFCSQRLGCKPSDQWRPNTPDVLFAIFSRGHKLCHYSLVGFLVQFERLCL